MLRRSFSEFSRRRLSAWRVPRQGSTQVSSFVCARREFSSVPQQNARPNKSSGSAINLSKFLVGGVVIGSFTVAYSRGYLDDVLGKWNQSSVDPVVTRGGNTSTEELQNSRGSHSYENKKESMPVQAGKNLPSLDVKDAKDTSGKQSFIDSIEDSGKYGGEKKNSSENSSDMKSKEENIHVKEEQLPKFSGNVHGKVEEFPISSGTKDSAEDLSLQKPEVRDDMTNVRQEVSIQQHEASTEASAVFQEEKMNTDLLARSRSEDEAKDTQVDAQEPATTLLETYSLNDDADEISSTSSTGRSSKHSTPKDEISVGGHGDLNDVHVSKDGKLILDFLQAIHAAEQRQAEMDARILAEEKRSIKDKYEKELKDARARELMCAEEAAMLEKELEREREKAAAACKSLQEKAEERLKMELEEKEKEVESKLKELQEFAKAELAASLAREKAVQVEKMAEANLNINALCTAFYARSESAHQTHSIHKLALGALALEDALSNGQSVQAELDALSSYIEGVDKDSLLQLALSSLPEDVRLHGTDSPLQLTEKFDKLKGSLRHFSLIPPNGGGILAHSLAYTASFLKVKEADKSGDGIESVINKVESLLAQGKLAEAADTLEDGVKGTKAGEFITEWSRRARNRAITEQALVLLQSYAASVTLT